MNRRVTYLSACLILLYSCKNRNEKDNSGANSDKDIIFISTSLAFKSNTLISLIRDGKLDKDSSLPKFKDLLNEIKEQYNEQAITRYNSDKWVFPLKDYTTDISIGNSKDEGYIPGRYNFFDGNDHKGHAALDIFIADSNQDCADDRTKKQVDVLSMTGGVVLAAEMNWDTASALRGGKYIWIYDPLNKLLLYYAHNNTVIIKPGQIVKPGEKIATCGRTGLNAFKKRSPTHLHLMILKLDENNYPRPINPYGYLKTAKPI
ncbi:MAG TPA: M23 family metallopeptidase [Chitinophagaceae bacterium]|nr:M23 family metallopeptidase [Chitinophagaceae bacterium]